MYSFDSKFYSSDFMLFLDELSLRVGDVITLHNDQDSDWWRGEVNGKVGIFPKTYVARI